MKQAALGVGLGLLMGQMVSPSALSAEIPVAESVREQNPLIPTSYYMRLSFLSSRNGQENTLRTLKTVGTDESGSMSENSVIPNLNYLSGMGLFTFQQKHRVLLAGLQSISPVADRTISTPFVKNFALPGQILAFRYSYALTPQLRIGVGSVYLDTFKFADPTVSLSYFDVSPSGWMKRLGLSLSAPLSSRSRAENLLTRATARSSLIYSRGAFSVNGGLSHSRPFNKGPVPDTSSSRRPAASQETSGSRSASQGFSPMMQMDAVDQVLGERETSRTTGALGASFTFAKSWTVSTGAGAGHMRTQQDHSIWLSSLKPIELTFAYRSWEVGSNLTYYSDLRDYQSLSMPKLWNVGVRLSYSVGEKPFSM